MTHSGVGNVKIKEDGAMSPYDPTKPVSAKSVEQFDVRISESPDLIISIAPLCAPWNVVVETYEISESAH